MLRRLLQQGLRQMLRFDPEQRKGQYLYGKIKFSDLIPLFSRIFWFLVTFRYPDLNHKNERFCLRVFFGYNINSFFRLVLDYKSTSCKVFLVILNSSIKTPAAPHISEGTGGGFNLQTAAHTHSHIERCLSCCKLNYLKLQLLL